MLAIPRRVASPGPWSISGTPDPGPVWGEVRKVRARSGWLASVPLRSEAPEPFAGHPAHALRAARSMADRRWRRPPTQVGRVLPRFSALGSGRAEFFAVGTRFPPGGWGCGRLHRSVRGEPCRARDSSPTPIWELLLPPG